MGKARGGGRGDDMSDGKGRSALGDEAWLSGRLVVWRSVFWIWGGVALRSGRAAVLACVQAWHD